MHGINDLNQTKTPAAGNLERERPAAQPETVVVGDNGHTAPGSQPQTSSNLAQGGAINPPTEQDLAKNLTRMRLAGRLSGAQVRKQKREQAAQRGEQLRPRRKHGRAKGDLATPRPPPPPPGDPPHWRKAHGSQTHNPAQKRRRNEGSDPPSEGSTPNRPDKRAKADTKDATTSYSLAVHTTKMAVVMDQHPEQQLSQEQCDNILCSIQEEAFNASPGEGPSCSGCYAEKGVIYILCNDKKSQEWLSRCVAELKVNDGVKLRTGVAKDILQRSRVSVRLPTRLLQSKEPKSVLKKLEGQNPHFKTDEWVIFAKSGDADSITLCVEIDEPTMKSLEKTKLKASFGLYTVAFKVIRRAAEKTCNAEGGANQPTA